MQNLDIIGFYIISLCIGKHGMNYETVQNIVHLYM